MHLSKEEDCLLVATCWPNRRPRYHPSHHFRRYIYHSTLKTFWIVLISTLLVMVVTIQPVYYPILPRSYLQNRNLTYYLQAFPISLLQAVLISTYLSWVVQISLHQSSFYESFGRPLPLLQPPHFVGRLVPKFSLRFYHQLLLQSLLELIQEDRLYLLRFSHIL